MGYCCRNCFVHSDVLKYIDDNIIGWKGDCDYCGREETQIFAVGELTEFFEPILEQYEPVEAGEHYIHALDQHPMDVSSSTLFEILQENYPVFDDTTSEKLIYDILNDNCDDTFLRVNDGDFYVSTGNRIYEADLNIGYLWNEFIAAIKYDNRYFPKNSYLLNKLETIFGEIVEVLPQETLFYRARNGEYFESYQLGSPPKEKVLSEGRANPTGISYLYCADSIETAIAEVRPTLPVKVSVANVKLKKSLKIIDLTESSLKFRVSLFDYSEERKDDFELLRSVELNLAQPVRTSSIDYAPIQFIVSYISYLGYDGIKFKSSLAKGKNIVIFNSENVCLDFHNMVNIKEIKYEYEWVNTRAYS